MIECDHQALGLMASECARCSAASLRKRIDEAFAAGREAERAAVVKDIAAGERAAEEAGVPWALLFRALKERIERGLHLKDE